jgi:hypothetical protein
MCAHHAYQIPTPEGLHRRLLGRRRRRRRWRRRKMGRFSIRRLRGKTLQDRARRS